MDHSSANYLRKNVVDHGNPTSHLRKVTKNFASCEFVLEEIRSGH